MPSPPAPGARRRRAVVASAVLLGLLGVGGCSTDPAPAPATTSAAATTPTPSPSPGPSSAGLAGGPVLAVKIDHTGASYPRVGLSKADVVYVEPVEGGLTRLLAIFSSSMPAKVGPVRSARESDVDLLANYGRVAFAFSGGSSYTLRRIVRGHQVNLSNDASTLGFERDHSRPAPYNVIGTTRTLLQRAGGSVKPQDPGFRYGTPATGGTTGARLRTSWQAARVEFAYSAAYHKYTVTSDGRIEKDALYGNRNVLTSNVLVQYVSMSQSGNRDVNGARTPLEKVIGSGRATLLRNGRSFHGTWSRRGATSPTRFTVAGQTMTFAPGQTWVLLVPPTQAVRVS